MLYALIKMLYNTKLKRWHPIFYYDKDFPGGAEANKGDLIRFKSKGHHTEGFEKREDAVEACNQLQNRIKGIESWRRIITDYDKPENDLQWDGEDIPADTELITRPKDETNES